MSITTHARLVRFVAPLVVVPAIFIPLIGSVAFTAPAGAQSGLPVPGAPMQVAPGQDLAGPATTVQSGNWSGYAVSGSTYTHVSTTVVIPQVTCKSKESAGALWVGLDGYANKTV